MAIIPSIRGMRDLLPAETAQWRHVEAAAATCFANYGYGELRTPALERADLFRRQLGEDTDIVQKEMYAFTDVSGDELCLRPEATVPTVRAVMNAGLHRGGVARVWYGGQMFRRERPQKGRYRQFWQIGAEAIGGGDDAAAAIDAEQILMLARFWQALKIGDKLQLRINNLGAATERAAYRKQLTAYFRRHADKLDEAAQARIDSNPLRILDSKDEQTAQIAAEAPPLQKVLGDDSIRHVETVKAILTAAKIEFTEDPALVRGLDYYNLTVFEWVLKDDERRQNALCGGGRYDGLSEQIGGVALRGSGFALGLDRLISLLGNLPPQQPDCFVVASGNDIYCTQAAESMREAGLSVWQHGGGGNMARQLKKADAMNVSLVIIAGADEESAQTITIKRLRDGKQCSVPFATAGATALKMKNE
ncbi:MAG: histidine--tRNA ligase [Gammaproteobacteria bacterium WSBS_2016_MAG_OTU1]